MQVVEGNSTYTCLDEQELLDYQSSIKPNTGRVFIITPAKDMVDTLIFNPPNILAQEVVAVAKIGGEADRTEYTRSIIAKIEAENPKESIVSEWIKNKGKLDKVSLGIIAAIFLIVTALALITYNNLVSSSDEEQPLEGKFESVKVVPKTQTVLIKKQPNSALGKPATVKKTLAVSDMQKEQPSEVKGIGITSNDQDTETGEDIGSEVTYDDFLDESSGVVYREQ